MLSKPQEHLLQKLIHNDALHIDVATEADEKMMQELYHLFFSWTKEDETNDLEDNQ